MKNIVKNIILVGFLLVTNELKAQNLFDLKSRWILVDNKIDLEQITLTPYDSVKCEINTLILTLAKNHKIIYDYKSNAEVCYGVDFLDIDLDNSSWHYDPKTKLITFIIKGGYSSIEDFKFKRDYEVWRNEDGDYELKQVNQHYFTDLTLPQPPVLVKKRNKK